MADLKILLFGASGLVGTAIEYVCKQEGHSCVGLNHEDVEITRAGDIVAALEKYQPSSVVNLVAMPSINPCEEDPELAFRVNTLPILPMAKWCEKNGRVLVQTSTHAVFDGSKVGYYTEDDSPNPFSVYSGSKYISERFTRNLCSRHYVLRFPTMYGARRNKTPGFVDKILERIQKGEGLRIADDKMDTPTYALDVAERLVWMLREGAPYGVYHLANSGITSYYGFIRKLIELVGADVSLEAAKDSDFPALAPKPLRTALRSAKLEPMRPWEEALADFVANDLGKKLP